MAPASAMSGHRTSRTMLPYWLLLSWFGSASLEYIDVGPSPEALINAFATKFNSHIPFTNFLSPPQGEMIEPNGDNTDAYNDFYQRGEYAATERKRRTVNKMQEEWPSSILDDIKQAEDKVSTPLQNQNLPKTEKDTEAEVLSLRKRSFSPWGGKRSEGANIEQMWTWKRAARNREPSMPKRVRFSPWGGKRSGQVIYKPGGKVSRVIYSTSIPALTRILSNYSPSFQSLGINGYEFTPSLSKRHPIQILALSSKPEHIREALPFTNLIGTLPALFKPGHPYVNLDLKKDGKRKVVFSQWGGKRSPPIIGPIWTPAPNKIKEDTLDAILLIRKNDINALNDEVIKSL